MAGLARGIFKAVGAIIVTVVVVCACVLAIVAACNAFVVGSTRDDIVSAEEATGFGADCILVLGASVLPSGVPSVILQDRLDVAANLYFAGAAPKVIVSGDNREDSYNEVAVMKSYLVSLGVPSEDVFCDHAGFNTYDSMWRAHSVFGVQKVIVVTQTYHEYRALFNAQGVGMDAIGVSSDARRYANQNFYDLREVLARVKDAGQVLAHAKADIQGEPISLDQSGDVTD